MTVNPTPSKPSTKPQAAASAEKAEQAKKPASAAAAAGPSSAPGPAPQASAARSDQFRMSGNGLFKLMPGASSQGARAPENSAAKQAAWNTELLDFRPLTLQSRPPSGAASDPAAKATTPKNVPHAPDVTTMVDRGKFGKGPLEKKLQAASLKVKDFSGLRGDEAADLVARLAAGKPEQRENLVRLMKDPSFAESLKDALGGMKSEQRVTVFKALDTAVSSKDPAAAQMRATLGAALDAMSPTTRHSTLMDGLLGGDPAAQRAVNGFLESRPQQTAELLTESASHSSFNDTTPARLFDALGENNRQAALGELADHGFLEDVRRVFHRLGELALGGKQDQLGDQFRQTLDALPVDQRAALLTKVAINPENSVTDGEVNQGKRLIADYFNRIGPEAVKQFLGQVAQPAGDPPKVDASDPRSFLRQNAHQMRIQAQQTLPELVKNTTSDPALRRAVETPATFGSEGTTRPGSDAPRGVAEALHTIEMVGMQTHLGIRSQAHAFAGQLKEHQNDPAWLKSYFGALGSKKTAELLSAVATGSNYNDFSIRQINENLDGVRQALTTLRDNGGLKNDDLSRLMDEWGKAGFNPAVGQLFSGMPAEADGLKTAFVRSASNVSRGMSGPSANDMAAAGALVLASTPADNQLAQLNEMRSAGTLDDFVKRGMGGSKFIPSFYSNARDNQDSRTHELRHPVSDLNDGMARLMQSLAHSPEGTSISAQKARDGISRTVFNEAVKALGDDREKTWSDNVMMKDALSQLYVHNYARILGSNLSPNQATFENADFARGMQGFFQNVLFTPPLGENSSKVMSFMSQQFRRMTDELRGSGLEDKTIEENVPKAHRLGLLQGLMMNGLQQAKDKVKDDATAMANALGMVLQGALALVPGASKLIDFGKDGLDALMHKLFEKVDEKVKEKIKQMSVEKATQYLLEQGSSELNFAEVATALAEASRGKVFWAGEWLAGYDKGRGTI